MQPRSIVRDGALHGLLLGLVLSLFGLQIIADLGWAPRWLPLLVTLATVVAGGLALTRQDRVRLPLLACLGLLCGLLIFDMVGGGRASLLSSGCALLGLALLAFALLRQLLADGPVTAARIEGAVALYLVVALFFATAYEAVDIALPGAFNPATLPGELGRFRYFSLVAQTSTGFGDIVPVAPLARTLATLQAVTGQIFVAVLLARLVALQINTKSR